jgi:hypothetical protein
MDEESDDSFKQDPNHPVDRRTIGDVCQVIDALGGDFRYAPHELAGRADG